MAWLTYILLGLAALSGPRISGFGAYDYWPLFVPATRGDVSHDRQVTFVDIGCCISCWNGPGVVDPGAPCWQCDFDNDNDVDLFDCALHMRYVDG